MNDAYASLLETIALKEQVQKRIKDAEIEFDRQTEEDIALFSELTTKEENLRKAALEQMEEDNVSSVDFENKTINKRIRITNKIESPLKVLADIYNHYAEIEDLCMVDQKTLDAAFEKKIEIIDKPLVNSIINKFEQVNGKQLDGVVYQETKFITIKDN